MSITVTTAAVAHIRERLAKEAHGIGIRLGVTKSGCSGHKYAIAIIAEHDPDDLAFPIDDRLAVYVSPESYEIVKDTTIDLEKQSLGSALVFHNPRGKNYCGCGESFNLR